jgi:hypothetical protein
MASKARREHLTGLLAAILVGEHPPVSHALANSILSEKLLQSYTGGMEQEPPLEDKPRDADSILGELALVLSEMELLEYQAQRLVDEAREQGATWAQVGAVVGVKPQSAYQRWSEQGREKHREYQRKRRAAD